MSEEFMSRRNLNFVLYEMLDATKLTENEYYKEHSRETFEAIIDVAEQIAREKFFPHHMELDATEPVVENGRVKIIPEVKEALDAYAEAGFLSAHHSEELGGIQLPRIVTLACQVWFSAANIATLAYLGLTKAAANLIEVFGTEEQKEKYLGPMLEGRYYGTMVLTEPQAGSSLADVATTARPTDEGHYLIKGNKIFISCGEHELSENIIHLVLARLKDAPPGIRGLSLFIVPRYRVREDGSIGEPNDVALAGLIHKMGYRGTTSTMLNFGENDDCRGYLIGEPNKGLACMFHMMNEARINVGIGAVMQGYAGYLYSLDYARNRPQGRPLGNKDPKSKQVMLVEHPDIRRMLLMQKAYVEGTFALGFYSAWLLDQEKTSPDEEVRRECGLLLELLTPIIKAWSAELTLEANYQAIQILGGYGYTRDYPVEQYYRNNRLNPIHEGANGIQAMDLLGRKVSMHEGAAFNLLVREIEKTVAETLENEPLREWASQIEKALNTLKETTADLLKAKKDFGPERVLANASIYQEMFGHVVIAWLWLKQAQTAIKGLEYANEENATFYKGKLQACRYYFTWDLPKIEYQSRILRDLDPTCLEMQDAWF